MAYVEGWGEFVRNESRVYYDYTQHASPAYKAALEAANVVERAARELSAEADKAVFQAHGDMQNAAWAVADKLRAEYIAADEALMAIWELADADGKARLMAEELGA